MGNGKKQDTPTSTQDEDYSCIVNSYLEYLRACRNYSAHTIRAYKADIASYYAYAARQGFCALAPSTRDIRGYLSNQTSAQYSRKTINRRLSALRMFFRWMNAEHISASSAVCAVRGPKVPKHLPAVLSAQEIDRFFDSLEVDVSFDGGAKASVGSKRVCEASAKSNIEKALRIRDRALFEFMYATGARVSEVSQLTLHQVDCAAGVVRLFGKGSKERETPLHGQCIAVLQEYFELARPVLARASIDQRSDDCDAVFLSKTGKPLSSDSLRKIFKKEIDRAGLDQSLSPHAMRHTFATDLLNGGADLRSVQELLGHASLSTTQIYTHLTPDRLKSAYQKAHPRA